MNGKIIFAFALGAAAGFVASWKYNETKYKKIADDEIESVKEMFVADTTENTPDENSADEPKEEQYEQLTFDESERNEYEDIVKKQGYVDYSKTKKEEEGGDTMSDEPYVISPDEFGELDDYETNSLTLYADGILADDGDDAIEDIEGTVGEDSLNHFGEYEDDSVFVRNDRLKTDYEILLDTRRYADVVDGYPIGEED